MPTTGTFEQLLAQRVLMINPSPQLLAASKELENSPLGKPGRFDHLASDDDWAEMRSGVWPMAPFNQAWADKGADRAEQLTFQGPEGSIDIRVIRPSGEVRGALFHTHGGGWIANSPASFDYKHAQAAEWCGLVVGCVDWRKAPQHPYPAALDDLEAGAFWFSEYVKNEYGVDSLYLRGESSGGNTGAATMLRMKQKHGFNFSGAVLDIGCFDMTAALPSHTEYDDRKQAMDSVSVDQTFDLYLQAKENRPPRLGAVYASIGFHSACARGRL